MSVTLNTTQVIAICQKNGVSVNDKILALIDNVETEVFNNVRKALKEVFTEKIVNNTSLPYSERRAIERILETM